MPLYTRGNKTYQVEAGQVIRDINSSWPEQQFFTINGATVQLRTSVGENNKRSIQLVVVSEKATLSVQEIYDIMDYRVKAGQASTLEKAAMWQLKYKEMARAEAKAQGYGDSNIYNAHILTEKQVLGMADLPNLKKVFPWAYASKSEIESDRKWKDSWLFGRTAAFRERCRANLAEIRGARGFDYTGVRQEDHTIYQEDKLAQSVSTQNELKMQAEVTAMQADVAAKQLSLNKPQSDNTNNPQPQRPAQRPQYPIKDNGGLDRA